MAQREGTIQLTLQERRKLQEISRYSSERSRARIRATILLMSAETVGARKIAKVTETCKRVVKTLALRGILPKALKPSLAAGGAGDFLGLLRMLTELVYRTLSLQV